MSSIKSTSVAGLVALVAFLTGTGLFTRAVIHNPQVVWMESANLNELPLIGVPVGNEITVSDGVVSVSGPHRVLTGGSNIVHERNFDSPDFSTPHPMKGRHPDAADEVLAPLSSDLDSWISIGEIRFRVVGNCDCPSGHLWVTSGGIRAVGNSGWEHGLEFASDTDIERAVAGLRKNYPGAWTVAGATR